MSRHVVWSAAALDELLAIGRYIATDNPNAAAMVSIRLRDTAHRLGEMATGRPGRVTGTYEKIAPGLPYILAYEIVGLTEGPRADRDPARHTWRTELARGTMAGDGLKRDPYDLNGLACFEARLGLAPQHEDASGFRSASC